MVLYLNGQEGIDNPYVTGTVSFPSNQGIFSVGGTDSASYVGFIFRTTTDLATAGGKLVSFRDNTSTELAAISYDGKFVCVSDSTANSGLSYIGRENTGSLVFNALSGKQYLFRIGGSTATGFFAQASNFTIGGASAIGRFGVYGATTTDVTGVFRAVASQTADMLQLQDSSANVLYSVDINGFTQVARSASNGGGYVTQVRTVQTTGATVTDLATIAVAQGDVFAVEVDVIGRKSDGTDRAMYKLTGLFYRNSGGNVTQQGSTVSLTTIESNASWDCTLNADTSNQTIDVRVTGVAATTINWKAVVRYVRTT